MEDERLDSSVNLPTSLNKNEFPNEVKLDTAHSPACLFPGNSRKQIEEWRGSSRIKSIIFLGALLSLLGVGESESKTGLNHRNRLTPIRLHSPAGISFPPTRFPLFSFFSLSSIVVQRIFDRPLFPLSSFFRREFASGHDPISNIVLF